MATRKQRTAPIAPRIEPIRGSVGAPPVPGNRDIVEDMGAGNRGIADSDGRRDDLSARHQGNAVAGIFGGAPKPNKVTPAKY